MTVIATVISRTCSVHATDSLITARKKGGGVSQLNWKATKIVPVPKSRGMLAYYGFAGQKDKWTTLDWLRKMAASAPPSAEQFAEQLALDLETQLRTLRVHRLLECGIGIHFVAYERVDGYSIPEMFHISNWGAGYASLRPGGVGHSRESYSTMFPGAPRKPLRDERLALRDALLAGNFLQFNNGDPLLFNPVANSLLSAVHEVGKLGARKAMDLAAWRALTRRSVQVVSAIHQDFVRPERRTVGGRVRDLALTPGGQYTSTSGEVRSR